MGTSKAAVCASLLAGMLLSAGGQAEDFRRDAFLIRIYPDDYFGTLQQLSSRGYDVAGVDAFSSIDVILDDAGIQLLTSQGLKYEVIGINGDTGAGAPDPRYSNPDQVS